MAWARVQSAYGNAASLSAVSAAYGTALSSGNKLIALVSNDGAGQPNTVGDGTNNMTQMAAVSAGAGGQAQVSLWAMDVPAGDVGGTPTITAAFGASVDSGILIQEVSGLLAGNTTAMLDGTAGTSHGTGGGSTTSPTYSSTAASEYLVCCFGDNAFTNTIGDPAGYTADANNPVSSTVHTYICFKNSTNGAESGVYTYSNAAASYGSILVAFKLAGAATVNSGAFMTFFP